MKIREYSDRILLSDRSMIPSLKRLWKLCFGDSDKLLELFFENRFQPEDCAVYLLYGEPAAAVYMLPSSLSLAGQEYKTQYIYAAATHPRQRQHGLMSELLRFSEIYGRLRGKDFSVLVPGNAGLFSYYKKRGYDSFASVRKISLPQIEASVLSAIRHSYKPIPSEAIHTIRKNCLKDTVSLQWDEKAVSYALEYYSLSGGRTLTILHADGSCAYAIYRRIARTEIEIIEIFSENNSYAEILHAILESAGGVRTFHINAEVNQSIAMLNGETIPFGMIKALTATTLPDSVGYVGLPLD